MKYKYASTPTFSENGRIVKRPLVEIEMVGKERNINALGLLDSGADSTLVNMQYAKILGIALDEKKKKDFVGIQDARMSCYLAELSLRVKHVDKTIVIPVAFIDSPSVDVLLGQEGFFDAFKIKFEKDHDTFELVAVKK